MDIKDKIKLYLGEAMGGVASVSAADKFAAQRVVMKNKPVLIKMLQHMNWNDHRLTANDLKKDMGDALYNQIMNLGWLQKTRHPGEWYELSPSGVNAIGGLE
jgi:hypothetical protein